MPFPLIAMAAGALIAKAVGSDSSDSDSDDDSEYLERQRQRERVEADAARSRAYAARVQLDADAARARRARANADAARARADADAARAKADADVARAKADAEAARAREEEYAARAEAEQVQRDEEELQWARNNVQYDPEKIEIAVCGFSRTGKSSLVNAFRGLKSKDSEAAPTVAGVDESNKAITRYPDPRMQLPYRRFVWVDCPGHGGTIGIPSRQYFKEQGLFIFDIIILVYDTRLTEIDFAIIANCERLDIPLLVVHSKADSHIKNTMKDLGHDENDDDDEDENDDYQERARQLFTNDTWKNFVDDLEKAQLNKPNFFIVSNSVIFSAVTDQEPKKKTPRIDEDRLLKTILETADERRRRQGSI
jgi:GTP-binding protein EngB required for normal cell division